MIFAGPSVMIMEEGLHSQLGIQACANENQDDGCQQDDCIIHAEAEGTGAPGKHGGPKGIDGVGRGIQAGGSQLHTFSAGWH